MEVGLSLPPGQGPASPVALLILLRELISSPGEAEEMRAIEDE